MTNLQQWLHDGLYDVDLEPVDLVLLLPVTTKPAKTHHDGLDSPILRVKAYKGEAEQKNSQE